MNEARIYVGTYAKYNNGTLQGEWVSLSDFYDLDGFLEYCAEIHEDEEEPEYMFQDWENIPDSLIDESNLEENFFELRDELDRLNDTEKEAFWTWAEGNNIKLTRRLRPCEVFPIRLYRQLCKQGGICGRTCENGKRLVRFCIELLRFFKICRRPFRHGLLV